MNDFKFEFLKGAEISDEVFETFYNLLKKSFPRVEYRSFNGQKALLSKEIYEILFCFDGEKIIGAMSFWRLDKFVFIEHFAVDESERGRGIGTKMLEKIQKRINGFVILEVELPYNEISKKRISFYERNGFVYNDFEYFQQPLNKGDEPLPLRIMSYPKRLSAKEFEEIRKRLVKAVYNS